MRSALLASAVLLLAVPAFADNVKDDINKANAKWVAAYNKGDAAAMAKLYTEKATALPPGADMVKGRAAIQALWADAIKSGWKNVTLSTVSVERYGSAAREIGRVSLDVPGQQNQTTHVEGKYVVVWKRVHGGWQVDTDIWNMNK